MKLNFKLPEKLFGVKTELAAVYLPLLGLIILILISVNLVLLPKIDDSISGWKNLGEINNQRDAVLGKVKYLRSIDQTELKKNADSINAALLPQKNAYLLVGIVRNIGDQFGFQIDSFTVNPGELSAAAKGEKEKVVSGVSKIPVKIVLVGPSARYLELIKGMESNLPILSLDSFKMQSDGDTVKLDLQISAYYIEGDFKVDINRLSLADLALSKEESAVLTKLGEFTAWGNSAGGATPSLERSYTNYNRSDPFIP